MNVHNIRRRTLHLLGLLGLSGLSACALPPSISEDRFAGKIPQFGTLRLDANPEKSAVTVFDEHGYVLASAALLSKKVVGNFHGGSRDIPRSIRATWRTGQYRPTGHGGWTDGTVMGDYTTTVAERIPPEVFAYIRQHGGSLRLKIRIVDGAVLVGWDVEKYTPVGGPGDSGFHYYMVGGDFREDQVFNGKVVEPGWERVPAAASGRR